MKNKWLWLCLMLFMLAAMPFTAYAQEFDAHQKGSLSVTLVSPETEQPMVGAPLSVYYVATVDINEEGNLQYVLAEAFEDSGIDLEDPKLVSRLEEFVSQQEVPFQQLVTDSNGKATATDLPLGLYFIQQTGAVKGFAPCDPFLVTIPSKTDDGFLYEVDASPKTEVERLVSITIKKVWNTDESTTIPSGVTVQLLRNDKVVKTATLNKQNNWQFTFADMPESDSYRIEEVNVPEGFIATYKQKGYVFTVTNTASLPHTGQLVWPIPVLAVAGVFFLLMSLGMLRKSRKGIRKALGIGCILLGLACWGASAGFVVYNRMEAKNGEEFSQTLLQDVQENLKEASQAQPIPGGSTEEENPPQEPARDNGSTEDPVGEEMRQEEPEEMDPQEMVTISAGEYESIGILSIPVLEMELPILTEWSYEKLKKAPCHYYGTCYEENFVIGGHYYPGHFGRLPELQPGDLVLFTDALGEVHCYEVVLLETLLPTATEEMITSGFDLSLYTCTTTGDNRVTVRCRAVKG